MRIEAEILQLSASDLVGFLNCRFLSEQDLRVAAGELTAPFVADPMLDVLRERGAQHEKAYIDHLASSGLEVIEIEGVGIDDASVAKTLDAMRAGIDVIVQAALMDGIWRGRADVLRRVEKPSLLGAWSYVVIDTKLARQTKAGTILQLSLYSAMLSRTQGLEPEFMYVVMPWREFQPEPWRVADFSAYFRRVQAGLEALVGEANRPETYPEPVAHCDVCRWRETCDERRHSDDHLSLVAGISKVQRAELVEHGVETTAALAAMPLPLQWKPGRGSASSYVRAREQARVQVESRETGELKFELLPIELGFGLTNLPEPSEGDVFLDFEADPFVGEHGLEYLCGFQFKDDQGAWAYRALWALSREAEREIFEQFIDFVADRRRRFSDLHVYHYGGYEAGALKRLAGRYATREDELDDLLRGKVLVDLLNVVRQGIRAGVESYSIKRLEPLYRFDRETRLADANVALRRVETALELNEPLDDGHRQVVQDYNEDDCVSTRLLRDWLEGQRSTLTASGVDVPRPELVEAAPSENVTAWLMRITPLVKNLTVDVPDDDTQRSDQQQARWILAHLLDWHRREAKSGWWEYFRLSALTADELFDERAALSGLEWVQTIGGTQKCPVDRYRFPPQEADVRPGKPLKNVGGDEIGTVEAISLDDLTIDIKKRQTSAALHPSAVFVHEQVSAQAMMDSLVRLAEHVVENGLEGQGPYQAARELLLRRPTRLADGSEFRIDGETTLQAALRIASLLDGGSLPIQGPPGTGKTYTGSRMVCELVRRGKKVGIVANSHAVIRNFIDCVREAADELGLDNLKCVQKPKETEPPGHRLRIASRNAEVFAALADDCQVAAGTAWLWSTPAAFQSVDVLFVDEAAQMSLANSLAVAPAARSIVMLGDPQQLDQPTQGSHPDGTAASALDHVLNGRQRVYKDRLLERGRAALAERELTDEQLGAKLLDLLIGPESGLLGWRTDARIKNLRAAHPGVLERSAGALARSSDELPQAVEHFVQETWPALSAGQDASLPYSESRNLPSMIAAFARPAEAYAINTDPAQRTHKALLGSNAFGNNTLTAAEYAGVLNFANLLLKIMRDEWGWAPRDLWDVQGFIWAVNRADKPAIQTEPALEGASPVYPTNLILYGPPGTGKTYATTREAVMLCDGQAADDRSELKQRYDALMESGQIAFVTFHQSYSYEDFVEGLRPTTAPVDESDGQTSAGFRLEPRHGIFRDIVSLAEQARTNAKRSGGFDLSGRSFVKMSLGRAGSEDYIYDAAIDGNYVVLGYGGNVDWSDPKYDSYDAIFEKWNEIEPGTKGNSGNIAQVWRLRAGMREGDIVIISEGNSHFRAIGEITGPYRFEPTGVGTYNHKRPVRWLLVLDDPLPVDTIYDGQFTMMSCYGLKQSKVKKEALARLLPGDEPAATSEPDQFVLIVDEINRANISKVFGELITLIEPDKRLGADNALKLKLPYSGDSFGVPSNLHIVGTMNTADRSIALLDTALRRRFEFRELMPNPGLLSEDVDGVPVRALLRTINERIEYLFDREHQIGHAYFIHCTSRAAIDQTMRDRIIPLLQEYFYEDWSKVALVLGDAEGAGHFIERKPLASPIGGGADGLTDERFRWSVKQEFQTGAYDQFR